MLFSFCPRICRPHKMQRRIIMAFNFAIQTAFEILVVVLIIYGFWHEDKLITFEDDLKAKILNRKETKRNGKPDN